MAKPNWGYRSARLSSLRLATLCLVAAFCVAERIASCQTSSSDPPDVHEVQLETLPPGREVTITGRYFSSSSGMMQVTGTDVRFRLSGSQRSMPRDQAIRVRGRVTIEGGQRVVNVDHLEVLPSEIEQVQAARAKLEERVKQTGNRDYQAMHTLAAWAKARGVWYSDRRLLELAADCQAAAYVWDEEDAAEKQDFKRLTALAQQARGAKLDRSISDRIQHRAVWVELRQLKADDSASRQRLADTVRSLLPGSENPLPRDKQPKGAAYLKDPISLYLPAKTPERADFHRALWAELISQALQVESQTAGANLPDVARRGAELLADRPEVVRTLKLRNLQAQAADPAALTRGKLAIVEQQFRELEELDAARKLVIDWLSHERSTLGEDDAEGRLRLAADYVQLAADPKTAAALYIEALQIVPTMREAETELGRLDYLKVDGVWRPRSEVPAEVLEQQRRQRSGAVAIGDREQDVIQRFRRPDRVSRTVSRERIHEQWIYQGPPALYIFLERKTSGGDAVVTGIHAP